MPDFAWIYLVRPVRPGFPGGPTPAEAAAIDRHFEYLKVMLENGSLVLAGPCLDTAFGIVVFRAADKEAAGRVMRGDPAVQEGVFTSELHAFRVSLLAPGSRGLDG